MRLVRPGSAFGSSLWRDDARLQLHPSRGEFAGRTVVKRDGDMAAFISMISPTP